MPKLNELQLGNEKIGDVDFADMPAQRGGFTPLVQPGTYRFKFPVFDAGAPIFDTIDTRDKGKRLNLIFSEAFALTIIQSPGGTANGQSFDARISNVERNRARTGEPEVLVSDLDYLLRDALGVKTRPKTNAEYAKAMIANASGKEFTADVEFTWNCAENRDIFTDNGDGNLQKVEGTKGCGARYYQGGRTGVQKVPADANDPNSPLIYPERITCAGKDGVPCGAVIRAFTQLRNFKS